MSCSTCSDEFSITTSTTATTCSSGTTSTTTTTTKKDYIEAIVYTANGFPQPSSPNTLWKKVMKMGTDYATTKSKEHSTHMSCHNGLNTGNPSSASYGVSPQRKRLLSFEDEHELKHKLNDMMMMNDAESM